MRWHNPTRHYVSCGVNKTSCFQHFSAKVSNAQKNRPPSNLDGLFIITLMLCLLRLDSTSGASIGASAAINALVLVDLVDVALRDGLYGALADAGAAGNALVSNFVSHGCVYL